MYKEKNKLMDTEEIIIILSQRITKLENDVNTLKNRSNKYLILFLLFIIIFNYYENVRTYPNKLHMFYDIISNTFTLIQYGTLTSLLAFIMLIFI